MSDSPRTRTFGDRPTDPPIARVWVVPIDPDTGAEGDPYEHPIVGRRVVSMRAVQSLQRFGQQRDGDADGLEVFAEIAALMLTPESHADVRALMDSDDRAVQMQALIDALMWIAEEASGVPFTKQQPDS